MNIFRNILIGLASLIFIIAVTGFVYLFTIQTTIMDRAVVKSWLSESKIYDGRLIGALVQATNAGGGQNNVPQPPANALSPTPEALRTALNATFTPEYTQTQIEGVVNNAYDWIDGTSPEFSFSIPIDQKRDTLIAELSKALQPQIAALPVCQTIQITQASICRPSNISVEQMASQLTSESIKESNVFAEPITNESFSSATQAADQQPQQTNLTHLPEINKNIDILLLVLPAAIIVSLTIIILASVRGTRMARAARLSRRVFFSMLFIFLPTAIVVWLAKDNDFGLSRVFAAETGQLMVPLIKTITVGVLSQLALVTGAIGALGAVSWIILSIIGRGDKPQPILVTPPIQQTTQQPVTPPQQPQQPITIPQPITQTAVEHPYPDTPNSPLAAQQPIPTEQPPVNYQG